MKTNTKKLLTTYLMLGILMTTSKAHAYVEEDHWASEAIHQVMDKNLMEGTSENEFSPDEKTTLGEFITILGRYSKVSKEKYTKIKDNNIKPGEYYTEYMNWAVENNLLKDIKKSAEDEITREETAHILASYLRMIGDDVATLKLAVFLDESEISKWATGDIQFLANKGIMTGTSESKFSPKASLTRAEIAQIISNMMK